MTIQHTTNYQIAYADAQTALVDLASVTQQVAQSLDAAMGRAGYTPPDATSFAALSAQVTALNNSVTGLSGYVTALQNDHTNPTAPALTAAFAPFSAQTSGADFQTLRMWRTGRTAFAAGLIKTVGSLTGDQTVCTIPAGMRPSLYNRTVGFAIVGATPMRLDINTTGALSLSVTGTATTGSLVIVNVTWPLD